MRRDAARCAFSGVKRERGEEKLAWALFGEMPLNCRSFFVAGVGRLIKEHECFEVSWDLRYGNGWNGCYKK